MSTERGLAPIAVKSRSNVTTAIALKIFGIAFAVGLDVLALSIAVGIMQIPVGARIRLGLAFSASEVLMQLAGYALGAGAGRVIGTAATYLGFLILAGVGAYITYESFRPGEPGLKVEGGWGFVVVCASISLDSLGIGVSLPGVPLPLIPLLATVAVSTAIFTTVGIAFGSQLGKKYEALAERGAGVILIVLAILFTVQHAIGWGV